MDNKMTPTKNNSGNMPVAKNTPSNMTASKNSPGNMPASRGTPSSSEQKRNLQNGSGIGFSFQCNLRDHEKQPLNLVCTQANCNRQGLICANCLSIEHKNHAKQCVAYKVFLSHLKQLAGTQKSGSHTQLLSEIEKKYIRVRKDMDDIKKEFEMTMAELSRCLKEQYLQYQDQARSFESKEMAELLDNLNTKNYSRREDLEEDLKKAIKVKNASERDYEDDSFYTTLNADFSTYLKLLNNISENLNNLFAFVKKDDYREKTTVSMASSRGMNSGHNKDYDYNVILSIQEQSTPQLNTLALLGDNTTLVSGNNLGKINLWNYRTGQMIKSLDNSLSEITCVTSFEDGSNIAVGSKDGLVKVWNTKSGSLTYKLYQHSGCVSSIAYIEKKKLMVTGGEDKDIVFWEAATGRLVNNYRKAHNDWIWSIVDFDDGERIASSGGDCKVKIWNIMSGALLNVIEGNTEAGCIFAMISIPTTDGNILVTGDSSGVVKVIDPRNSKVRRTIEAHESVIHSLSYLARKKALVSAGSDKLIKLWDLKAGGLLAAFSDHEQKISTVTTLDDGVSFASNSWDKTVKIWSL